MENIFTDKGIIGLIPFFAAIYLSFRGLLWAGILISLSIALYYLITNIFANLFIDQNKTSEKVMYRDLVKNNFISSGIVSIMHLVISIITAILLYPYLYDITAYTLFWLLIASFLFNFLYRIIFDFDIISEKFRRAI